ncbi:MAG: hypothetical protein MZV70_50105, partial [Desulfobacterales bacterium]|nr:hypothetical protein [Desulfobacterales bacterium]
DPPPEEVPDDERPKVAYPDVLNGHEEVYLPIRKARISDVEALLELVNGFAAQNLMLPRGPQYLFEKHPGLCGDRRREPRRRDRRLRQPARALGRHGGDPLHGHPPGLSEAGARKAPLEFLKQEAVHLGIRRLFTFTLSEEFFARLGFSRKLRDELPPKVWGECSRCPKYFKCDEVGMVLEI